ncbi:MAG: PAS domain S-box protein [Chitinophagaceae bacterium]|nr:PAS domain S-box protein [Chitinophagaceae bacterium]
MIAPNKMDDVLDFEAIFEYASIGILVTDSHGTITAVNPFALKEFGYSKNELEGRAIETLIPARFHNSHVHLRENYSAEMQCRPIGTGRNLFAQKKDGTEFSVEICLGNYYSRDVKYVIAFIKNISARTQDEAEILKLKNELETTVEKRTQELQATLRQLEISKERLRKAISFQKAIFDNAGVMISATDEKGILKYFNPEACQALGYHASEVINKSTPVLFHDINEIKRKRISLGKKFGITFTNDFEVMVEKAKRNIHEEEQYTYIRKNGTTFPVSLTITGIRDRHGEITGYMGVAVDISERIKAADELKNVQQLFLQLLRNYPDGSISIIDKQFCFVYTGGELHTRLNTDHKALIGKKIYPNFPEKLRRVMLEKLADVFNTKRVIADFELPGQIAGNTYVMDAFPLLEEDGTVHKAGVIIRNISTLKKIEDELREGLKKEKELSELKSRFVSMASHEFRTPLSTVLSSAYLIEKYTGSDEQSKREKHLQRILSSVNMLTDILNDFLSVGKLEEGKIQVRLSNFNIREMIVQVIDEIKNTLKKDQEIHYNHAGNTEVLLDVSLLKHIIMNLVSNASKFSPETTIINIETRCRQNSISLSVKDHGIGISREDQRHLMERFFRGANAGNIEGTGLGLHIVSKYAELMNGLVTCKSELEKGTEFIITFNKKHELYEKDIADRRQ